MISISINDIESAEKILCNEDNIGKIVILKNCVGKFIRGTIYRNCISIGSGYIIEYDTAEDAYNA